MRKDESRRMVGTGVNLSKALSMSIVLKLKPAPAPAPALEAETELALSPLSHDVSILRECRVEDAAVEESSCAGAGNHMIVNANRKLRTAKVTE